MHSYKHMQTFAAALVIPQVFMPRKSCVWFSGQGMIEMGKFPLLPTCWLCDLRRVSFPLWASVSPFLSAGLHFLSIVCVQ